MKKLLTVNQTKHPVFKVQTLQTYLFILYEAVGCREDSRVGEKWSSRQNDVSSVNLSVKIVYVGVLMCRCLKQPLFTGKNPPITL